MREYKASSAEDLLEAMPLAELSESDLLEILTADEILRTKIIEKYTVDDSSNVAARDSSGDDDEDEGHNSGRNTGRSRASSEVVRGAENKAPNEEKQGGSAVAVNDRTLLQEKEER
ncbi:unnamed protein product, partial [Amoebophrya sp. A25]|eukprot:GSA25T00013923001.1